MAGSADFGVLLYFRGLEFSGFWFRVFGFIKKCLPPKSALATVWLPGSVPYHIPLKAPRYHTP